MNPSGKLVRFTYLALLALLLVAPVIGLYPVFVMKLLCFALFACAFNLLLGFTGLLSFGHAAFFGGAAYVAGWFMKAQGWTPELGMAHDLLLVMEKSHRNEIAERMPQLVGRTMLFGQWIDGGIDLSDPYRRPRVIHDQTVALIRRAGAEWIARLNPRKDQSALEA